MTDRCSDLGSLSDCVCVHGSHLIDLLVRANSRCFLEAGGRIDCSPIFDGDTHGQGTPKFARRGRAPQSLQKRCDSDLFGDCRIDKA